MEHSEIQPLGREVAGLHLLEDCQGISSKDNHLLIHSQLWELMEGSLDNPELHACATGKLYHIWGYIIALLPRWCPIVFRMFLIIWNPLVNLKVFNTTLFVLPCQSSPWHYDTKLNQMFPLHIFVPCKVKRHRCKGWVFWNTFKNPKDCVFRNIPIKSYMYLCNNNLTILYHVVTNYLIVLCKGIMTNL